MVAKTKLSPTLSPTTSQTPSAHHSEACVPTQRFALQRCQAFCEDDFYHHDDHHQNHHEQQQHQEYRQDMSPAASPAGSTASVPSSSYLYCHTTPPALLLPQIDAVGYDGTTASSSSRVTFVHWDEQIANVMELDRYFK